MPLDNLKEYHQRYKVCEEHLKIPYIIRDGQQVKGQAQLQAARSTRRAANPARMVHPCRSASASSVVASSHWRTLMTTSARAACACRCVCLSTVPCQRAASPCVSGCCNFAPPAAAPRVQRHNARRRKRPRDSGGLGSSRIDLSEYGAAGASTAADMAKLTSFAPPAIPISPKEIQVRREVPHSRWRLAMVLLFIMWKRPWAEALPLTRCRRCRTRCSLPAPL